MTDSQIVEEAVKQIKEWQDRTARELAEAEARSRRKQAIIDEVVRQTGIERVDAARYVAYVMNNIATGAAGMNGH